MDTFPMVAICRAQAFPAVPRLRGLIRVLSGGTIEL